MPESPPSGLALRPLRDPVRERESAQQGNASRLVATVLCPGRWPSVRNGYSHERICLTSESLFLHWHPLRMCLAPLACSGFDTLTGDGPIFAISHGILGPDDSLAWSETRPGDLDGFRWAPGPLQSENHGYHNPSAT